MMKISLIWRICIAVIVLLAVFWLGRWMAPSAHDGHNGGGEQAAVEAEKETIWTCSMHPQVRQPEFGTCPICAMDLIPLTSDDDGDDDSELPRLRLSERAVALMNIQTAPVQRREAFAELRLPGKIALDETRLSMVSAWFEGRVDRLYVDFSGSRVQTGEHLAEIYSPQLFGAQEEYLQAIRAQQRRGDGDNSLIDAAHSKLRLLGLSEQQIAEIGQQGEPKTHLTYYSPVSGTVVERMVSSGQYLQTGSPMFRIADLSHLWVELQAFESEIQWLRYGQEVEFTVSAFPGKIFTGRIAYLDSEVSDSQRSIRVRVNIDNEQRQLKPGMLVVGKVRARIAEGGKVFDDALAGKWISPMHPEIVKDQPGTCDVCGMDLVPAEEMGYFAVSNTDLKDPLLIPASAPLFTGKRAVVYVRVADAERPTFEARTVELGQRIGDSYPVESGLIEGELVVLNGQFKIDSELQIRGRQSMMSATAGEGDDHAGGAITDPRDLPERESFADTVDANFSREIISLIEGYFQIAEGLAADDIASARSGLKVIHDNLLEIGQHRLSGDAHVSWMNHYEELHEITHSMAEPPDIANFRKNLQGLTLVMESIYINFGGDSLPPVYRTHCPMVEGGVEIDGDPIGTWLQKSDTLANPYWGAAMLRCGEFHGQLGE